MRTHSHDLRPIAPDLWVVDVDAWNSGIHLQSRTTVVRLSDGTLWLCSPGPIDDGLAAQLRELGQVAHLVAPNLGHYLFFEAAAARYPDATTWGAPGLAQKQPGLPLARALEEGARFGDTVVAHRVEGAEFIREVTFLHAPSSSLLCTDLVHNMHEEREFFTRLIWRALGTWKKLGMNRRWRWLADRPALERSVRTMLEWEPARIVMAHGDVLDEGAVEALTAATEWLRDGPPRV